MKFRISSIFAFLFGTLLLGVLLCCCMFYDNNTGTINPTQNKVYTQDEYNSNYENGYASGTDKLAELTAQINTLNASLDAKIELIAEYENNKNIDATTINDLRAEITRLNNTIAILQADIDRYIEQLNNPTTTTVTATFYLNETDTDIYYTKILNTGDTLLRGDIPTPENTTYLGFTGWYTSDSDDALTSVELLEDTVFYGKWETIAVDAVFVGFNDEIIESKVVGIGEVLTAPEPPVIDGYKFTGWIPGVTMYIVKDMTYTANYEILALNEYKLVSAGTHCEVYDQDLLISEEFDRINNVHIRGNCAFSYSGNNYTLTLNTDFPLKTFNNDMILTEKVEVTATTNGTSQKLYIDIYLEKTGWSIKSSKDTGDYMYVWIGISTDENSTLYTEFTLNNLYITLDLA